MWLMTLTEKVASECDGYSDIGTARAALSAEEIRFYVQ